MLDPGSGVARKGGMTASVYVSSTQEGHNFLVVKSHAVKDFVAYMRTQAFPSDEFPRRIETIPELVVGSVGAQILFGRWQATVRHAVGGPVRLVGMIHTSRCKGNDGSTRMFEAYIGCQDPQVGITDLIGKLFLDGFEKGPGHGESGIFRIGRFRGKAHPGPVRAPRTRGNVVRATAVPGQTNQNGCQRTVVPRRIVH
eukprot:scaffold400_cov185-Amphora_coffeaeformis.AAC.1